MASAPAQRPLAFRAEVKPSDVSAVGEITRSTGFFNAEELDIATELVEARLSSGLASGYLFLFAEDPERVLGYACYGPIAGTAGSYDLYWIATRRDAQRRGVGQRLLAETERRVREAGGLRLYVETSGRALYAPTQAIYAPAGYRREAELADFYAPGDAKVFFV